MQNRMNRSISLSIAVSALTLALIAGITIALHSVSRARVSGNTAWATFKYTIAADLKERHVEGGGLGTAALEKRDGCWLIVHWHTSSPRRPPAAQPAKKN